MTNHHYMFPRVTEVREVRPSTPLVAPVRRAATRASQRRLVELSLIRVPKLR
jgi:hypothetical protein